jgi:chorismate--pyruvate lyase
VEVEVLHQGRLTLWPQERKALRTSVGHVREVILRIDGRPAVWARSSTSLRSVKGPWRAMKGLGTRPLAELLFQHHRVRREGLRAEAWATRSFQRSHVRHHWRPVSDDPVPMWARRSIFRHRGQALQVLESFAPWVLPLDAGPTRR